MSNLHIFAPNTIELRAELDVKAKILFIGYNSPARTYLVWSIGLSKLKYCGKEF